MNEQIKKLAEEFAMHTETMSGIVTDYVFDLEELERFYEMAFEAGRMVGFKQDKALTELARIGQEIERGEA